MIFLGLLCLVSIDGVDYESEDKTVLVRFTRKSLLPSYTIGKEVEKIISTTHLDSAFYHCSNSIGKITFEEGSNLREIGQSLFQQTSITDCDFSNCKLLESIPNLCFGYCNNLKTLILPPFLKSLGNCIISNTALTRLEIPDTLEEIPDWVDNYGACIIDNPLLTDVIISQNSNLTKIGSHAFMGSGLTSIHIPSKLQTFNSAPFLYCNIQNITVDPKNQIFSTDELHQSLFTDGGKTLIAVANGLTCEYTIDSAVEKVTNQAFRSCKFSKINFQNGMEFDSYLFSSTLFKTIDIPSGVTYIPSYLFADAKIEIVKLPETVKTINYNGFSNAEFLKEINIPESVTSIENFAFANCRYLNEITIPSSVTAYGYSVFSNCSSALVVHYQGSQFTNLNGVIYFQGKIVDFIDNDPNNDVIISSENLTDYNIPGSIFLYKVLHSVSFDSNYCSGDKQITFGASAFQESKLTKIQLPTCLSSVGDKCFAYCQNLQEVDFSNTQISNIGSNVFIGSNITKIILNDKINSIGTCAFYQSALCDIDFQNSNIQNISDYAFSYTNIQSITFPSSIQTIGNYAFYYSKLESISFSSGSTSIEELGKYAFANNKFLTSANLSNSITLINDYCFSNCPLITSITLPNSNVSLGISSFEYCTKLTTIILQENTNPELSAYTFEGCSSLNNFDVSQSSYIFEDGSLINQVRTDLLYFVPSSKRRSFIIPGGIKKINQYAFHSCHNLQEVIIPDGAIEEIGYQAFMNCDNIIRLYLPSHKIEIQVDAFLGCTSLRCGCVTIPESNKDQAINKGKVPESVLQPICTEEYCYMSFDKITCKTNNHYLHIPLTYIFIAYNSI